VVSREVYRGFLVVGMAGADRHAGRPGASSTPR
jgi:hypothetical protein